MGFCLVICSVSAVMFALFRQGDMTRYDCRYMGTDVEFLAVNEMKSFSILLHPETE